MKKLVFLILVVISSTIFAESSVNYEFIRTAESPGFFMVKIIPVEGAVYLQKNELYVKNFAENQAATYRELFPFLQQQRQAKIIDIESFDEKKTNQNTSVIFLGEPYRDYEYFRYESEKNIFDEFQNFAEITLSPVILDDIKLMFGGNAFDIYSDSSRVTSTNPAIFIGKFRQEIPTRMELTGLKADGSKILFNERLDFARKEFTTDKTAQFLPELWDDLANPIKYSPEKTDINAFYLLSFFPYIVAVILIIGLYFLMKYFRKNNDDNFDFEYESEVPVFQPKIPESEYRKYDTNNYQQSAEIEAPFEVVWKN